MLKGTYRFTCVFLSDARLPEYKGSTIRGVFGRSLKKVVCALRRQSCEGCILNATCAYSFLFEGAGLGVGPREGERAPSPPKAYVIEPPLDARTLYEKGERIDFTLLLFGDANRYLRHVIYAFDTMGEEGIGARVNGSSGRFRLDTVSSGNTLIYSSAKGVISGEQAALTEINPHDFTAADHEGAPTRDITVELVTPLRVKYRNHLEPDLPFHVLVRASLRRVSTLFDHFGEGQPPLDYRGLVRRAMGVRTRESTLRWVDWKRYSFRQEQKMLMGGMMGCVTYGDVPAEYLPLLRFCEQVHIGKQSTFGLGKFILHDTGCGRGGEKDNSGGAP